MPNKILTEQFEKALERSLESKQWPEVTSAQRVATTAIGAGAGAGIPIGLGKLLGKSSRAKRLLIPSTLALGALGFMAPDIVNRLIKTYPTNPALARKYIKKIPKQSEKLISSVLNKTAGWNILTNVGALGGRALKYGAKGALEVGRGLTLPVFAKGMPVSERALSVASKGLVGYGAFKGGKKLLAPPPPADYITYLRNQILAGNIRPEELNQNELGRVMKRGI